MSNVIFCDFNVLSWDYGCSCSLLCGILIDALVSLIKLQGPFRVLQHFSRECMRAERMLCLVWQRISDCWLQSHCWLLQMLDLENRDAKIIFRNSSWTHCNAIQCFLPSFLPSFLPLLKKWGWCSLAVLDVLLCSPQWREGSPCCLISWSFRGRNMINILMLIQGSN